jgi:hypothetical protein
VAKIYIEEQKYDSSNSSFDHKLVIFHDICQCIELPLGVYVRAFPTILKGLAQDHFYSNLLSHCSFDNAYISIRNFFEGPGYYCVNLDK